MMLEEGIEIARGLGLTIHDHAFGKGSYRNLEGVHPDYITVAELALKLNPGDGTVIPGGGLRTAAQAAENVKNKTGVPLWRSEHRLHDSTGYGHAFDLIPYDGGASWNFELCLQMAKSVRTAAAILSTPIRQGLDWDQDGVWLERGESDMCHTEKPKPQHETQAHVLMLAHRLDIGLDDSVTQRDPVCACPACGVALKVVAG